MLVMGCSGILWTVIGIQFVATAINVTSFGTLGIIIRNMDQLESPRRRRRRLR
jgi:hypothetical protein